VVGFLKSVLVDLVAFDLLNEGDDGMLAFSASARGGTSSVAAGPFWAATTETRPETRA
jgi:hypothetical protein